MRYKERPNCRVIIEFIMEEYGWTASELKGFSKNESDPKWKYCLNRKKHKFNVYVSIFFCK